jgi:hypothetical protein
LDRSNPLRWHYFPSTALSNSSSIFCFESRSRNPGAGLEIASAPSFSFHCGARFALSSTSRPLLKCGQPTIDILKRLHQIADKLSQVRFIVAGIGGVKALNNVPEHLAHTPFAACLPLPTGAGVQHYFATKQSPKCLLTPTEHLA